MSLSDNFIKRPVLTTVCSILIVLMGIIAIPSLPIENLPNIAPPLIQVTANYGGANSVVTEQAVTNLLEQQINGVPGAAYISSTSSNTGQSIIQVYFNEDTDINIDQVNVQNRVSLAMPQLPQQVSATGVSVMQSTPSILLAYQVTSTEGQFDSPYINGLIYEQLYYQLERVPGVAKLSMLGGSNPAFWLFVDPNKLTANQLTADQIVNAVKSQNSVAIGGLIGGPPAGGDQLFAYPILVADNGNLMSVEQLNDLIVGKSPQGNLLRLRDVGQATYGFNTFAQQAVSVEGNQAITVAVFQTPESNALDVSEAVVAVMDQFSQTVPAGDHRDADLQHRPVHRVGREWGDRCPRPGDRAGAGDPVPVSAELARHGGSQPGDSNLPDRHLCLHQSVWLFDQPADPAGLGARHRPGGG